MRPSVGYKLSVVFAIAIALFTATAIVSFRDANALMRTTALVTRSQRVLGAIDRAVGATLDAESAARAYVADPREPVRRRFAEAQRVATANATSIDGLAVGDAATGSAVRQLQSTVTARALSLARVLDIRDSLGATDAAEALRTLDRGGEGEGVRGVAQRLLASERAMLLARTQSAARVAERTDAAVRVALVVALVLVPVALVMVRQDTRERWRAAEVLRESEARLRAATDGSLDAFYILRAVRDADARVLDFTFVDLNARAESLLGLPREAIVGSRLGELIPANRAGGFLEKYRRVMESGVVLEEEFEVTTPQVHAAWIHHQVVPLVDGVAITSRDVTERRRQDDAMRALSLVDDLTGLYNRRGFLTLAQQQLKLARRGHRELLLLFVDMDDFKEINDTFGHAEGDTALRRTAELLKRTFRDSDIVGRLGGDEFVVLATDSGATTTEAIVQRLRRELRERNANDGYPYRLSFSVGVARFDHDAPPTLEELIASADAMLYEQKRDRRLPVPPLVD